MKKTMTTKHNLLVQIATRVTPPELESLGLLAKAQGISLSQLLKEAVLGGATKLDRSIGEIEHAVLTLSNNSNEMKKEMDQLRTELIETQKFLRDELKPLAEKGIRGLGILLTLTPGAKEKIAEVGRDQ